MNKRKQAKKSVRKVSNKSTTKRPHIKQFDRRVTVHVKSEWIKEGEYHPASYSGFVRDAIVAYKNNRHLDKFRTILSDISGELLILTAWKEKGHPAGLKWTEELDIMLTYYEKCFDVLMNSPFNDKLDD